MPRGSRIAAAVAAGDRPAGVKRTSTRSSPAATAPATSGRKKKTTTDKKTTDKMKTEAAHDDDMAETTVVSATATTTTTAAATMTASTDNRVQRAQASKAVHALVSHLAKDRAAKESRKLIQEVPMLWLQVQLVELPKKPTHNPMKIRLKHRIYGADGQVCLITKDPKEKYRELLNSKHVTSVNKIITLKKLRTKYKVFEARRILCGTYATFLADDAIVTRLPSLLGKTFFAKKKLPIGISMRKLDLNAEVENALATTSFFFGRGGTVSLRLGLADIPEEELVDNLMAAIDGVVERIPKKWDNVHSLLIRADFSTSLPIYNRSSFQSAAN